MSFNFLERLVEARLPHNALSKMCDVRYTENHTAHIVGFLLGLGLGACGMCTARKIFAAQIGGVMVRSSNP